MSPYLLLNKNTLSRRQSWEHSAADGILSFSISAWTVCNETEIAQVNDLNQNVGALS